MAVPLAALGASVHVLGLQGERDIRLLDLYRLPGDEPQRDTVLEHGDLITAIEVPGLPFATSSRYRKVRDRASYAFALVSLAAAVDVDRGVIRDVRLAFGGLATIPGRRQKSEAVLRGAPATEASFAQAADVELADAQPLRKNPFKIHLAPNILVRTLQELVERR